MPQVPITMPQLGESMAEATIMAIKVKPGDKVVFTPKSPNEPHTVTFPGDLGTEMIAYCEAGSVDIPFGPPAFNCNGGPPDEIEFGGGNGVSLVTAPGPTGHAPRASLSRGGAEPRPCR